MHRSDAEAGVNPLFQKKKMLTPPPNSMFKDKHDYLLLLIIRLVYLCILVPRLDSKCIPTCMKMRFANKLNEGFSLT